MSSYRSGLLAVKGAKFNGKLSSDQTRENSYLAERPSISRHGIINNSNNNNETTITVSDTNNINTSSNINLKQQQSMLNNSRSNHLLPTSINTNNSNIASTTTLLSSTTTPISRASTPKNNHHNIGQVIKDSTVTSTTQEITREVSVNHYWQIKDNETNNNQHHHIIGNTAGNISNHETKDVVVIHVCDENQKVTKDFCCRRDILIKYMKYFERFLTENENGYDDVDISVHCDIEIFEWLMSYIHEPNVPPKFDKSIIISILISSEFLQMDSLVDICIQHVSLNLNEIIKLPIDLSCISEKLINKIASLTTPKMLTETKDRKDKILTKLYKRRVELDFSRKGGTTKNIITSVVATTTNINISCTSASHSYSNGSSNNLNSKDQLKDNTDDNNNNNNSNSEKKDSTATSTTTNNNGSFRTIAASLTCCYHCGMVYLENYVDYLHCKNSPSNIDFRGRLTSRHAAINGWSLTAYLKALHNGGMGWDAIYWHVWGACIVFRVDNVIVSALEVDRYTIESDGLIIKASTVREEMTAATNDTGECNCFTAVTIMSIFMNSIILFATIGGATTTTTTASSSTTATSAKAKETFSLSSHDDESKEMKDNRVLKMIVTKKTDTSNLPPGVTSSLNPSRSPDILTHEIHDLLLSQNKYIIGLSHKVLIQNTMKSLMEISKISIPKQPVDFGDVLWGYPVIKNPILMSSVISSTLINNNGSNTLNSDNNITSGDDNLIDRGRSPNRSATTGVTTTTTGTTTTTTTNNSTSNATAAKKTSHSVPKNKLPPTNSNNNIKMIRKSPMRNIIGNTNSSSNNNSNSSNRNMNTDNDQSDSADSSSDSDQEVEQKPLVTSSTTAAAASTTATSANHGTTLNSKLRARSSSTNVNNKSSSSNNINNDSSNTTVQVVTAALTNQRKHTYIDHITSQLNYYYDYSTDITTNITKNLSILRSMSPELRQAIHQIKGPVLGIWILPHPLQFRSYVNMELLHIIDENINLTTIKKIEWELDLLREFDEKRMEQFEKFLVSRRIQKFNEKTATVLNNPTNNNTNNTNSNRNNNNNNTKKQGKMIGNSYFDYYYRDKGRQATK